MDKIEEEEKLEMWGVQEWPERVEASHTPSRGQRSKNIQQPFVRARQHEAERVHRN